MKLKQSLFRIAIVALASAATAASGVADATDGSHQPSKLFLQLDINHDGYVSRSEAASARGFDQAFADADENRDGKLSADEFVKAESIRQQVAEFAADSVITAKVKMGSDKRPGRKATRPPSAYLPNQQTDRPYKEGHETARRHETLRG